MRETLIKIEILLCSSRGLYETVTYASDTYSNVTPEVRKKIVTEVLDFLPPTKKSV